MSEDNREHHEDFDRLLKYERHVGDAERRALLMAASWLWDDLFEWAVQHHDVGEAELIRSLPPQFQLPAATDWHRWMVTFATVLWKLAQPGPPRPATMAEQLLVGILFDTARGLADDLHADGTLAGEAPPQPERLDDWLELYLEDTDHEVLHDPSLDGIDDESTDFQYGFGRMDYEGVFAVFNEHNVRLHGSPHPLAPLRMSEQEADKEDHVHRAVNELSLPVAKAALAGDSTVRPAVTPPDPPLAAFRISQRLGVSLEWDDHAGLLYVYRADDPETLALWVGQNEDE